MGEAHLDLEENKLEIYSHIIIYGDESTQALTDRIESEIEDMWNAVQGYFLLKGTKYNVHFTISSEHKKDITPEEIYYNTNPRNNYFRIEAYAIGNISFVDGLGSNTGYFLLDNLYEGSTTAAHEYGHTLGLEHPQDLDYRGNGAPGIMYPRGTLVDSIYQYDPNAIAGNTGGTMHPKNRVVKQADIELLKLHRLTFKNGVATVGDFTSLWHARQG